MHTFLGTAVSHGLAVGPVERIDHGSTGLHRIVCDPFRERALYDVAVVLAKDELRRLCQRSKGPDADILLFQIALLEDESFTNEIGDYIAAGAGGAAAVERAEQIFTERLINVDNEYIQERAVDVRDVCRRVVDILDGRPRRRPHLEKPTILVAEQFFPSDLFVLERSMVLGMAAEKDSATSHAALMARAMGIPMVVQLGEGFAGAAAGKQAFLDAEKGAFVVQPSGLHLAEASRRMEQRRTANLEPDPVLAQPFCTRDGTSFALFCSANLVSRNSIATAIRNGASGVGRLRTHSVLDEAISEEEQIKLYTESLESAQGKPMMVSLITAEYSGNDEWVAEQHRAHMGAGRFYLPQLRAILRTTAAGQLGILWPGIRSVEEWKDAKRLMTECRTALEAEGHALRENLSVGCIIDNPAAAIMAGDLMDQGAGTLVIDLRDLTRLTCGLSRDDEGETPVDNPAVQRLVAGVLHEAETRTVPVYLCGITAEELDNMAGYLNLGVRNFCVESDTIPLLKKLLCAENLS